LLHCPLALAQNDTGFGLGVMAGEPTGLSLKLWTGTDRAVDAGIAWSFEGNDNFNIHADYLIHRFSLIKVDKGSLPLYFGIGGRVRFNENSDDDLGIRVPVGLNYLFENSPIDVFLEVVPVLDLYPSTDLEFNAAIGARFFF
jgi:hypothetical protein